MRSVFLETLLTAATLECQKQSEFDCLPTSSGRTAAGHFLYLQPLQSTRHAFNLLPMDRQSFLHMMGSKPWTCSAVLAQTKIASAPEGLSATRVPYQQKLQGIGGSMVEFSPAKWEIRVQFPANARTPPLVGCGLAHLIWSPWSL